MALGWMAVEARRLSADPRAVARAALVATIFFLPWSIAGGQAAAAVALAAWIAQAVRRRATSLFRLPLMLWAALFAAAAVVSAVLGWRPAVAVPKLHRLLWFLLIAAVPDAAGERRREAIAFLHRMVGALSAGGVLALALHAVKVAWAMTRVPDGTSQMFWLFHQGSMRTPQFHMAALLFLLAGAACLPARWRRLRGPLAAVAGLGILLHFKRGVWAATVAGMAALGPAVFRRRHLAAASLVAAVLAALPPVRDRLATASRDLFLGGGRWELWTRAAPELIRKAPWGIGFGAMRNYELRRVVPAIEAKLNHLHNNALQVLAETGWIGLATWAAWMAHALVLMASNVRRSGPSTDAAESALARGTWSATIGLLMNGVVEYNFGAGTVLMTYMLLFGMAAALRRTASADAAPSQTRP